MVTEQQFLKDVASHQIRIVRDDGLHRHIQFRRPGSGVMGFDLITWPGCLCYTGDMGTYVFQRLLDMFEFFRCKDRLAINPGYWAEKLQAEDKIDGYRKWSRGKFEQRIREQLAEYLAEAELTTEQAEEVTARCQEEIIDGLDDCGPQSAYHAAMAFTAHGDHPFADWWEVDTDEYAHRYIWCCYALAWGIQQYDAAGQQRAATWGS